MARSPQELKNFKARMRTKKHATSAEKLVKELLEKDGRNFKNQIIIGFYIVDFIILDKCLVVEIDGGYHDTDYQKWYDRQRDIFLTKCGLEVLHIKNEEAHKVIDYIANYPYMVGWEKRYRHALGWANNLKGKALQVKKRNKDQSKLF